MTARNTGPWSAVPDDDTGAGRARAVLIMSGVPWDELDDGVQQVRRKLLEEQANPERPAIHDQTAWIAVVASRVAVDWHRSCTRGAGLRERLAARWLHRPPADHPKEHRVLALSVADGLDGLPTAQRQLLTLRYYADLSTPSIALLLDIPEGTVKSRLRTAVVALRTRLRDTEVI